MRGPNYAAWQIKAEDFPSAGTIEEQIYFLLGYGVLAPSIHNTQPWEVEVSQNELLVRPKSQLSLPEADPLGRNLQISLSCFVTNMEVAASYFGFKVETEWSKDKIRLKFNPVEARTSSRLLDAISSRYSDKLPYQPVPLKKNHKDNLIRTKPPEGCKLILMDNREQISQIADTHKLTILDYARRRQFFVELSEWLRPNDTPAEDGMPGFVVGLSNVQSKTFRSLIRGFKPMVKVMAKKDKQAIDSSSAVAFISTGEDSPSNWFKAGQYYEALALEATASGMVMTPMMAMIENPKYLGQLAETFSPQAKPQIFFRLGYSKHKPYHTPRRSLIYPSMRSQQKLIKLIGNSLENKQVQIGPYTINYIVAGKGEPVVLLHGANIGWPQWYRNIAALSQQFKVYALDLPGAGNSSKVKFHKVDFEEYVSTADSFIKSQRLERVSLIGSSFGGWIAMRLAITKRPYINKIVLANPLGFTNFMPIKFRPISVRPLALALSKTALKPTRKNKNLEKFMRDVFFDKNIPLETEFIDYFYELSQTSHNVLFISRLAHISGMRKELFLKTDLPKIKKPVMVVWGKEDPLMPFSTVEDSIRLIPNITLHTLEQVGHMPPIEAADRFNKLTINFLKG